MQKVMVMCLVASAVLAASCATLRELGSGKQVRRAMLVGAGIGVGTGTVAGVATKGGKGALTGALFGAVLGAASSYLIHGALQRRDAKTRKQTLLNLDKFAVSAPTRGQGVQDFRLSAPDVDQECFDWEVRGNQLVQQHCVWTIRGNATWQSNTRRQKQ